MAAKCVLFVDVCPISGRGADIETKEEIENNFKQIVGFEFSCKLSAMQNGFLVDFWQCV